jgi:hypothetical protein
MILPRIYRNQHLVLGASYNSPSVNQFPNIQQVADKTGLSYDDVMQAAHLLSEQKLVHIQRDKTPFVVVCSPEGAKAFLSQKILEEGKERGKVNLLRWVQILGIVLASLISVVTFVNSILNTNDNTSRIQKLELEVSNQRR